MKQLTRFLLAFGILLIVYIAFYLYTYYINKSVLDVSNVITNNYCIQSIMENKDSMDIQVYYPITKNEEINRYILFNVNKYIKDFEKATGILKEIIIEKPSIHINFETIETAEYLNFVFNVRCNVGEVQPDNYIFTITMNKKKNKLILIKDLENMYEDYLVKISNYCYNKLKEDVKIKQYNAESILELGTKATKENYKSYIVNKEVITILFEKRQVAPYVLGEFRIDVPVKYLNKDI